MRCDERLCHELHGITEASVECEGIYIRSTTAWTRAQENTHRHDQPHSRTGGAWGVGCGDSACSCSVLFSRCGVVTAVHGIMKHGNGSTTQSTRHRHKQHPWHPGRSTQHPAPGTQGAARAHTSGAHHIGCAPHRAQTFAGPDCLRVCPPPSNPQCNTYVPRRKEPAIEQHESNDPRRTPAARAPVTRMTVKASVSIALTAAPAEVCTRCGKRCTAGFIKSYL